jgi:hypothetical protein
MAFSADPVFRRIGGEWRAVSRGARTLNLSIEAIRELECDFGFPLFERKAQGVDGERRRSGG